MIVGQLDDKLTYSILIIILYIICDVVPTPLIKLNLINNQTVGQPLSLGCSITTVRGITSRVDIVWSSNGEELNRTEGLNYSSTTNDSVLFTETYTIPQLSTSDEGRTITCDVFINAMTPVTATDNVTLNVTGKCNITNFKTWVKESFQNWEGYRSLFTWRKLQSYRVAVSDWPICLFST